MIGLACAPVAAVGVPALAARATPPPGSRPAGQGAKPRTPPTPPPVPSSASVIAIDLLQDAAIAAGALIVLIVPIIWYGSFVRRREQEAQASRRDLGGFGGESDSDPLLEYFGPQPGLPGYPQPHSQEPRFQPRPALAGRSVLSPAFAARPLLSAPPHGYAPPHGTAPPHETLPPRGAAPGQAGPASGRQVHAPAAAGRGTPVNAPPNRPVSGAANAGADDNTPRHPPVSGAPPWGPAPQPTSELPWAVVPGPVATGRTAGTPRFPAGHQMPVREGPPVDVAGRPEGRPERHTTRSSPPRSIFESDPQGQSGQGQQGARRPNTDAGSRPIYTWNPGDGELA